MRHGSRNPGFTLLEMAVALAVTIVLLAMATPSLGGRIARQRLAAVGHELAADLMLARQESAQRGQTVHVVFRPGNPWCWAVALGQSAECSTDPTRDPLLLKATRGRDQPGIELLDAEPFAIDLRNGSLQAGSGHADFRASTGDQLRVRLSPLGRASLCMLSGQLGALPLLTR